MEFPDIPSAILQEEIKKLTALLAAKDAHIMHLERSFTQHNEQLHESNTELLTQNEELQQTQEELLAQREFIEQQKKDLEKANKRMQANEQILAKAYEKLKTKEMEVNAQKAMLEEANAELLTQNEELQQTQEELLAQREFIEQQKKDLEKANKRMQSNEQILSKSYEKIKLKEVELQTQNEELQLAQTQLLQQRNRIEEQHQKLQLQTTKIKNSIEAALMIQKAILPHHQKMQQLLQNYFVIYKPKDIVSGDFWWVQKVHNKTFVAAIDCTGHGVAGAFMTLITSSLLNKTVEVLGIHQPAKILIKLHEEIQSVLQQKDTQNNYGMDMALMCLENQHNHTTTVTFAGAKRPIYIVENNQLKELKGTRKGIGGYQNKVTHFDQIEVEVPKGAWIYTGTDGLADQNDTTRKRLGDTSVKTTLLAIHHLPPKEQEAALLDLLDTHMKGEEQRDDILWLGFEILQPV